MQDPREGVSATGTIQTGADGTRIPSPFRPVLEAAIAAVGAADRRVSLYVYGSVATGMAHAPDSDVDLMTVGLPSVEADRIARHLTARFSDRCREVAIAVADPRDFSPDTDQGYGGCVFLKHYCVHLTGPDVHSTLPEFAADARAARGFNGDIADHARRWRTALDEGGDPVELGRRVARKTLLAVCGLVSVHDGTWTTDRARAAHRWAEIQPRLAEELRRLLAWSDAGAPDSKAVEAALDGVVARIAASFERSIGLWDGAQ